MPLLIQYGPWLITMGVLLLCSALFSASEAALFYLTPQERRHMADGNQAQRLVASLLADSDRLLTAVLFWNLVANLAYFTIASITSLKLERVGRSTEAAAFAFGSLLIIILLSEMLPKSLAVLQPRALATLVAVPLAIMVRLLDPIMPALRMANTLSQRVLWPGFQVEPYLRVGDLERAVDLSTTNATLIAQEQRVLQSIVSLSEIRADELMRPRTRFLSFRPPVSWTDLGGELPPSGYLLVTEPDSDEVASAIALRGLSTLPIEHLEHYAEPVIYIPWCASVAATLELMREQDKQVASVVNEHGETIGILTFDDILDVIFSATPSRSERLLKRVPIRYHAPGTWHVTGMTSLRRLTRYFSIKRPPSKSVTVAGVVQEQLQRLPLEGDVCHWGPFRLKILEAPEHGQLLVELTLRGAGEESS